MTTTFDQFEKLLRYVSKQLSARAWETTTMQVLDELADEFSKRVSRRADNQVCALLSFGS